MHHDRIDEKGVAVQQSLFDKRIQNQLPLSLTVRSAVVADVGAKTITDSHEVESDDRPPAPPKYFCNGCGAWQLNDHYCRSAKVLRNTGHNVGRAYKLALQELGYGHLLTIAASFGDGEAPSPLAFVALLGVAFHAMPFIEAYSPIVQDRRARMEVVAPFARFALACLKLGAKS